ncbi:hypothetical protein Q8W71_15530 [Methylobacterium sp. NEAU 140]|uniref:hypothetical protein n=1 Tax=Methylobacterium sp. NEAU 140 TaxID=3064945 RepID=UPI00273454BD|nr:hypothetical protein [Methylobacterium sp. NEAU 140]MDP4024040.1 hypothetical protein [Methylobacterium sp. NEAU 140]
MDDSGLPLFSGIPAIEPPPSRKRRPERRTLLAELVPVHVEPPAPPAAGSAVLLPFPPSRDQRLIADLAKAFISLRRRHGRLCRAMLLDKRFRPIATKLRRMGVQAPDVEAELARLEKAVARVVWIHDGRPDCSSGGGSAA